MTLISDRNPSRPGELQSCDALIIGGGPAGLAAAIALRRRGLDVVVVEALLPPIDKACGEGLMPDSLGELGRLGVELSGGREFSGIHFANRTHGREDFIAAEFSGGKGIGIRRVELHQRLIDRAEELGVRLTWDTRAELRPEGEVHIGGRPVRHRYLVGADGLASRVRRWANLDAGSLRSQRLGFRRHYRLSPWSSHVEVHWGQLGQAYITPIAEDEVCVAAITRHRGLSFDGILEDLPHLQRALLGAESIGRDRGAITTTRKLRRVTRDNIALIGDASGSADAITGEGLASTFREARLLGDALGRDRIADYADGHRRILQLPQAMASLMLTMDLWPAWRDRVMQTLSSNPEIFAAMLAVHIGEQSVSRFAARHSLQLALGLLMPREPQCGMPQSASRLMAKHAEFSEMEAALVCRPQQSSAEPA